MDLNKKYAFDKSKELSGVWRDDDDAKLLVARAGNRNFRKAVTRMLKPYVGQTLTEEQGEKIDIEAEAETILLGWENVVIDGVSLSYSKENVIKALTDYEDFRLKVSALSRDIDKYRREAQAAQEKNLENSSAGTPAGEEA